MVQHRLKRRRAEGEDGAVAVLVAVLMIVLIGAAAFVVDLGNARALKRKAQTAADAAALAGVRRLNNGDVVAVATDYVSRNGFGSATVNVPPATGSRAGDPTCVEVLSHGTVDTILAGVMGIDEIDVEARAVACATRGGNGGVAIYANSTTCQKAIDWSGSTTHIIGGVHTNNDIHIGGQTNIIDGPTTYRTDIQAPPDKVEFNPAPRQEPTPQAFPVTFEIADYAPGGTKAALAASQGRYHNAGNDKIDKGWLESQGLYNDSTGALALGLYYTTGDIDLSASSVRGDGVTFVSASGEISFSGSNHFLRPWDPEGLLAFTDHIKPGASQCNAAGVRLNGSSHDWEGIIFAPRSLIEMSGSSNTSLHGALIANTVKLNGSELNITYNEDFIAGEDSTKLVE
ncbi:MAG: pilus assembly protein TadG-related protein [Actinomycetota bacterium]